MHVIATAGHVDHGKSTLVEALTGTNPDRLVEERRRGLSIELGYCWTALPEVGDVAFVDVPGHERFVSTMLAGVGPVPAALLVVAADDPWMPQAAEHLAALDALGVRHGVVAVTRSDLADPAPAMARVREELSRTSLREAPVLAVSGRTGAGLDALRDRLVSVVRALPEPDADAPVRLWVDRRFTVKGVGTVVTGTLPAGTVERGGVLTDGRGPVRVRGVQALGRSVESVSGVARVALNLSGEDLSRIGRGTALTTVDAHEWTRTVDVQVTGEARDLPAAPMMHVGAASVPTRVRPLDGSIARLTLERAVPLHVGDRALLRDPGDRRVWGVRVLDPRPPELRRRGAAADRARALADLPEHPEPADEVRRREVVDTATLVRLGVGLPSVDSGVVRAGGWWMSSERADRAAGEVTQAVRAHDAAHPLDRGVPLAVLADRLELPDGALVAAVVRPPLVVEGGRVVAPAPNGLPRDVERAVRALAEDLAARPFAAPTADRLSDLGLDQRRVAAAARAGRLLRIAPGVVLMPGADRVAVEWLAELEQPFTASAARARLDTTRRVVLPLLDHLDRTGLTLRLPDDRRRVRP